jgi:hypothetical protein
LLAVGFQSLTTIQAHLKNRLGSNRTLTAIAAKMTRNAVRQNLGGMNLAQLADALGVAKGTLRQWLNRGLIRAILCSPELQLINRHTWFFPDAEIRRFILTHLEYIDLCRVEKVWFVDILTSKKQL